MAKIWTNSFPVGQNTRANFPTMGFERSDPSQINAVRDYLFALESMRTWLQLQFSGVSRYNLERWPGAPSTSGQITLQDGKPRTFAPADLFFDPSLGAADFGLDTGAESADDWYYLYSVPRASDDNKIAIRGSLVEPSPTSAGPTGFPNHRYEGPVRNTSSALVKMFHTGIFTFDYAAAVTLAIGTTTVDAAPVQLSLATAVPNTCAKAEVNAMMQGVSGGGRLHLWIDGEQGGGVSTSYRDDVSTSDSDHCNVQVSIPTPLTPKALYYRKQFSGSLLQSDLRVMGWSDLNLMGRL